MEPPEKTFSDSTNSFSSPSETNPLKTSNGANLSGPGLSSSSSSSKISRARAPSTISPSPIVPVVYRMRSDQITEIAEDSKKVIPHDDSTHLKADLDITWHTTSMEDLIATLGSHVEQGISSGDATRRLQEDGPNMIAPPKRNEFLHYASFLVSGFCPLLWVAAIMFFLCWRPLGDPDPAVINLAIGVLLLVIIALQAAFNAYQEHSSNKVMKSIFKMLPSYAHVTRNGKPIDVPTSQLVVGDIVDLNIGDKVPADMRLLSVDQMKVDRSMLTGESEPVSCSTKCTDNNYLETSNLAFLGSNVVEGRGRGVVVATGNRTTMGRITSLAAANSETSQLQKDITHFVLIIAFLSITTGILCIIVWAAWLRKDYPGFMNVAMIITTALSAIVAYVPEGLPVCVTLTLTIVAKHMSKNNALVKSLPTVETLGSVEILASDKTGTLTQNKMTVVHVYRAGQLIDIYDNKGLVTKDSQNLYEAEDPTFVQLVQIAALCNRAYWTPESLALPMAERKAVGDASDTALLQFADTYGKSESIRQLGQKIAEIPFNSKNKYALTVHQMELHANAYTVLIKGAAEQLLDRCETILNINGTEEALDEPIKKAVLQQQEALCDKGERVLALCYMEIPKDAYNIFPGCDLTHVGLPMNKFCFVGMTGLIDPPRPEVKTAVEQCRRAGITVAMVTGDHPGTAAAIARMVGIITSPQPVTTVANAPKLLTPEEKVPEIDDIEMQAEFNRPVIVKGSDLPADQATWDWVLNHKEIVFARTTPEQKLRIVKECQRRGKTVAVTGDGVNDAPALKQADIGIAMGAGSDVAREAADIVLTDNKFSTVVVGISNGRIVSENLKKVILYLLPAGSWSELTPVLANVFLGVPLPLSSFEMIYICIITDVFPSLSLIYEKPESDLMTRPPKNKKTAKLVDWKLLVQAYLVTGNLESFFAFLSFFVYMNKYGGIGPGDLFLAFNKWTDGYMGKTQDELNNLLNTAQTVFFVTLVLMQFGNLHSIRTRHISWFRQNPFKKETRNLYLFGAMGISTVLLIIAVYVPGFNSLFLTAPIPTEFWFLPFAYAMALFTLDETRKFVIRRFPYSFLARIAW